MDKKEYMQFELTGEEKTTAVGKCLEVIKNWDLTMPDDDPVARHFGLDEFETIGEIEFWLCNHLDQGYCSKFIFVFENQTCPYHHHKIKHETFYIVKGKVKMTVNGEARIMSEGEVLAMPVDTWHSFTGHDGPALVLEVSKPSLRQDSVFEDQRIGIF